MQLRGQHNKWSGSDSFMLTSILTSKGIENRINKRAYRNTPLTENAKEQNGVMSSVRYVVERIFGSKKRHYGARKNRFLGIEKVHSWITTISIAHNLKKAAAILRPGSLEPNYA